MPPGAVDLGAVLLNHSGADLTFGVAAKVERWDSDRWKRYGGLALCLDHWHCTADITPDGPLAVQEIGLSPSREFPGPLGRFTTDGLKPGWYRISQTANEGTVASGTFEVAEGADEPAPLVDVDEPSISVGPILTPSAGGTVTLEPLIPAPTGSQSITDVEAAIAGLAEVAQIEHWDDGKWTQVSDTPLTAVDWRVGRSATVPALEPGAYRLVRTGPQRAHTGTFWVLP